MVFSRVLNVINSLLLSLSPSATSSSPSTCSSSAFPSSSTMPKKLSALEFYGNYYGHTVEHLEVVLSHFGRESDEQQKSCLERGTARREDGARDSNRSIIFLVGDSSLDNKHWLFPGYMKTGERVMFDSSFTADAPAQYKEVLQPARAVKDVAYWLNAMSAETPGIAVINAAVEESTLADRSVSLLDQDEVVRASLRKDDILIVSIGGNDIALRPSPATRRNLGLLMQSPLSLIETGDAPGLNYFTTMFHKDIERYLTRLTDQQKPKAILVCMIYYPDEKGRGSWADASLSLLDYEDHPQKLQLIIRKVFELGTSRVRLEGTSVLPVPLYEVLDGKDPGDYVARVEPSVEGGRKMAELFLRYIKQGEEMRKAEEKARES